MVARCVIAACFTVVNAAPSLRGRADSSAPWTGTITWAGQQGTCMDVAGGRPDNGNKIQVWACTGGQNQLFKYDPQEEKPQIHWAHDKTKCLDVHDGQTTNFANIVLYDCHPLNHKDRGNQAFKLVTTNSVTSITWIPHTNMCLDLYNGIVGSSSQPNSKVVTHTCHANGDKDVKHQQWATTSPTPAPARALDCRGIPTEKECNVQSSKGCEWCGRGLPNSLYNCGNPNTDPNFCAN